MLTEKQKQLLIQAAGETARFAYAPYSRFRVGAALLCSDGSIYRGANVENRSYGLTICAERSAVSAAVSAGKKSFRAIAIYSPDTAAPLPPCGACRQVLYEFAEDDCLVLMAGEEKWMEKKIGELLPMDSLHDLRER